MKDVLIASYDLAVGGVERSLISMLENLNYEELKVDLMLYSHSGEFLNSIPKGPNVIEEIPEYATFRKGIVSVLKEGYYKIALARLMAKYIGAYIEKRRKIVDGGLIPMQLVWLYALRFLPKCEKEYDVAISYLWPHYYVAEKVSARKKIAWIHTDYSNLEVDNEIDYIMWDKYDHIVAVSEGCKDAFIKKYPGLEHKTIVVENINSPKFVKDSSLEIIEDIKEDEYIKLVTVARLSYAKGIDNGARACRELLDAGYKIRWYVVGYGMEEEEIKKLTSELNLEENFILLGKKINPYPYIAACDIYVQPSRYEGKAVTVTEAQILGKPVVITNYTTAASQVRDGIDGIITNLSVQGIVEGIRKVIDNKLIRSEIEKNIRNNDYSNTKELEKLYCLF